MPPQSFPECLLFCWLSCVCVCVCVCESRHTSDDNKQLCLSFAKNTADARTHTQKTSHARTCEMLPWQQRFDRPGCLWGCWTTQRRRTFFVGDDRKPKSENIMFSNQNLTKCLFKKQQQKKKNMTEMFLYASWWQKESIEFSIVWIQLGGEQRSCVDLCSLIFFLYLDCSITLRFPPSIRTDEGPRRIGPLKFSRLISVVFFYSSRSTLSLFNTHTHWIEAKTVWVEGQQ